MRIPAPKPQIPDLPAYPPPIGTQFRAHGGRYLARVRGYIDGRMVFRTWSRRKRRWVYEIEDVSYWRICILGEWSAVGSGE